MIALDMDGTLLRRDGEVDPRDAEAIARARSHGITVTIATGRIAHGTLPTARKLKLDAPVVCAEGAVIVDPVTGEYLDRQPLEAHHVEAFMTAAGDHGLAPFWFTHDEVHGEEIGRDHVDYVGTWSPRVTLHPALATSPTGALLRDRVTMAVGIGAQASVEAARERIGGGHGGALLAVSFPLSLRRDAWTLLVRSAHVDKAVGLAWVARRLGFAGSQVAVVGDWVNDIPMFRWAGRSFVMGRSPEHVAEHATDRLDAHGGQGGGVAEAIARLLGH